MEVYNRVVIVMVWNSKFCHIKTFRC